MHTYRLKLFDNRIGSAEAIEFDAEDAYKALVMAHEQTQHRQAELWCDGELLCVLKEAASGFWQIGSAQRATA